MHVGLGLGTLEFGFGKLRVDSAVGTLMLVRVRRIDVDSPATGAQRIGHQRKNPALCGYLAQDIRDQSLTENQLCYHLSDGLLVLNSRLTRVHHSQANKHIATSASLSQWYETATSHLTNVNLLAKRRTPHSLNATVPMILN